MEVLVVFAAKYLVYIAVAVFAGYFFVARRRVKRKLLLLSTISLPLVYATAWLAGRFWYNPRPFVESGIAPLVAHAANNGFPSDHMLLAAALAMLVILFNRPLGVFLWVLALAVGFSRVVAGIHHTVDILGAAGIAVAVVWLVHAVIQKKQWYRG